MKLTVRGYLHRAMFVAELGPLEQQVTKVPIFTISNVIGLCFILSIPTRK